MRFNRVPLCSIAAVLLLPLEVLAAPPGDGEVVRVSVSSAGGQGNGASGLSAGRTMDVSADGRYCVFTSGASNLVTGDTNNRQDVFRRDEVTGTTLRVSVGDAGQQGDGPCTDVAVTDDGRFVAFTSGSSNLSGADTNGQTDVYVWDANTGTSTLVSVTQGGVAGNGASSAPSISNDGSLVVFQSSASNLVGNDSNGFLDVYARDLSTGTTSLLSQDSSGVVGTGNSRMPHVSGNGQQVAFSSNSINLAPGGSGSVASILIRSLASGVITRLEGPMGSFNGSSFDPALSDSGRWLAFSSLASNIVPGDLNSRSDIFRADLQTNAMLRMSVSTAGVEGNDESFAPAISGDGEWVAFHSSASNLVNADTNGRIDVFVRQAVVGWTERESLSNTGAQLDLASRHPALSSQGRYSVFRTADGNVVTGDTNLTEDVFRHDRGFGTGFAGAVYCNSATNSSGQVATTEATGSPVLAQQNLTLTTNGLPSSQLGYYLTSQTTGNIPGFSGSQGVLCLGGLLVRLNGFVLNSGANGTVTLALPFNNLPPAASLAAGDTWNFQYWFRDVVGGNLTSNTADAVCVEFR